MPTYNLSNIQREKLEALASQHAKNFEDDIYTDFEWNILVEKLPRKTIIATITYPTAFSKSNLQRELISDPPQQRFQKSYDPRGFGMWISYG